MKKIIVFLMITGLFFFCKENRRYSSLKIENSFIENWENKNMSSLNECCNSFKGSGSEIVLQRTFKRGVRKRVIEKLGNISKNSSLEFYELYSNDNDNLIDVVINNNQVISFSYNYYKDSLIKKENKEGKIFNQDRKVVHQNFNDNSILCCDISDGAHPTIAIYSLLRLQEKGNLKLVKTITR